MCRMFAYAGDSREDLTQLVGALSEAAKRDTVAEKVPLKDTVHDDGWGFAVYSKRGLTYHRAGRPIFREDVALPPTEGEILAVFHARQATPGNPVGERYSHPLLAETHNGLTLLAHNGSLCKDRLAERLHFAGNLDRITDSELILRYAVQKGLTAAARDLEDCIETNSALNLLILEIGDNRQAGIFVKHFYRKEGRLNKTRYYELCYEDLAGGRAVFSSTLNDYGFSGKPMAENGLVSLSALK
jgi:predicted glutamine amidotransferase